jgi:N-acetylneuraminate synthase/N,N'-diacetyllegionaminate synthase
MNKVLIIAEAGVNHNGDINLAKKLIDAAAEAGADIVKFQTFKTEKLVSRLAKKAKYQSENLNDGNDSQFQMLKKLELSEKEHQILIEHCKLRKIQFLSTGFDEESVDELENMGISIFKIPSGEITNFPYLKHIGAKQKSVVLSTGMSNLGEIEFALSTLVKAGTNREKISILHCTTQYPTPMNEVNLNAMLTIKEAFKVNVGYSDHTLGIEIPIAAVALGAQIIEKHFTLDKTLEGPDHKASLEPYELKNMVSAIRNLEQAFGTGIKEPSASEIPNLLVARKSIHLKYNLPKGHILKENDLLLKRPGDGISGINIELVIGKKINSDLEKDHKLSYNNLE